MTWRCNKNTKLEYDLGNIAGLHKLSEKWEKIIVFSNYIVVRL